MRWISENPPGKGNGWEPYPISRRLVNWIQWSLNGNDLDEQSIASLALQTRHLTQLLEFHLLGNHLFANAKALLYAGLFFAGPEAESWKRRGEELIARELKEQVLRDGGHFELSPMYHLTMIADMLDILNILRVYGQPAPRDWLDATTRMLAWAKVMQHPDGEIVLFNDSSFDIAPPLHYLEAYWTNLGYSLPTEKHGQVHLSDSGYVRLQTGELALFIDIARVGPDYLPGHSHADTLSYEASVGRCRLLVDSGTSEYGTGPERQRQRGTAAHNTIRLAGLNSSDVWGGFRVGRRAYPREIEVSEGAVEASHDGYAHLPGRPVVRRRWELTASGWTQTDWIRSQAAHQAEMFFHFSPEVSLEKKSDRTWVAKTPEGLGIEIVLPDAFSWREESTTYHPRFGTALPSRLLVGEAVTSELRATTEFRLIGRHSDA